MVSVRVCRCLTTGPVRATALGIVAVLAVGACGTRVERSAEPSAATNAVSWDAGIPGQPAPVAGGASQDTAAPSTAAAAGGSVAATTPAAGSSSPAGSKAGAGASRAPGRATADTAAPESSGSNAVKRSGPPAASGGVSGAPAPGPSALPAAAGPKSEIVVASVGNFSGPAGAVFVPVVKAAQVWVKSVNARGGLSGHPVRLLTQDDGADPSRNKAIVKDLVERQGVIAFVSNYDVISGSGSLDYLRAKRIPVVGGILPDRRFGEEATFFPEGAAHSVFNLATVAAVGEVALPQKNKVGIIVCAEAQACKEAGPDYAKFAPTVGFQVVYNASASLAQPDYTAECLAARNAGAQVLFIGLDGNSIRRLAASCARQSYRPLLTIPATAIQPGFSTDPNMAGFVGASAVYPWFLQDARTAEYFAAKDRFAADMISSGITMEAWINGKILELAAKNLPAQPSSQSILDGLWTIQGETLGGLTQPLSYQRDKANPQRACWFTVKVENGTWAAPNGDKLSCK